MGKRILRGLGMATVVKGIGFTILASTALTTVMRECHRAALHSQILSNLEAINGVDEVCAMEHQVAHGEVGYCTAENLGKDYLLKGWPTPIFSTQAAIENGFNAGDNLFSVKAVGAPPTYLGHDFSWWKAHAQESILYRPVTEWIAEFARGQQSLNSQVSAVGEYTPDTLSHVENNNRTLAEKARAQKEDWEKLHNHNAKVAADMLNQLKAKKGN